MTNESKAGILVEQMNLFRNLTNSPEFWANKTSNLSYVAAAKAKAITRLRQKGGILLAFRRVYDSILSMQRMLKYVAIPLESGFSVNTSVVITPASRFGVFTDGTNNMTTSIYGFFNMEYKSFLFNMTMQNLSLGLKDMKSTASLNVKTFTVSVYTADRALGYKTNKDGTVVDPQGNRIAAVNRDVYTYFEGNATAILGPLGVLKLWVRGSMQRSMIFEAIGNWTVTFSSFAFHSVN